MFKAELFFEVLQYTGDASGSLRGDVGVYTNKESVTLNTRGPGSEELCRINVQTTASVDESPMATIIKALKAKFPANALVEVV
jgi:hypothetical protein